MDPEWGVTFSGSGLSCCKTDREAHGHDGTAMEIPGAEQLVKALQALRKGVVCFPSFCFRAAATACNALQSSGKV